MSNWYQLNIDEALAKLASNATKGLPEEEVKTRQAKIGPRQYDLDVVLLPGCSLSLTRKPSESLALKVERTRQIDIVCPRSIARVYFGSDQLTKADLKAETLLLQSEVHGHFLP